MENRRQSNSGFDMKITEDVRKYAVEQGVSEDEAFKMGMDETSKELAKKGAEVYSNA